MLLHIHMYDIYTCVYIHVNYSLYITCMYDMRMKHMYIVYIYIYIHKYIHMHHKYGLLVVKDAYLWVCTAMYCEPLAGLLLVTAKLEQGEAAKRAVVSWKPTVEWFWMVVVVVALF